MSQQNIRVMLVDDIADTRENMKKLLYFEDDIEVVGTAGTGEEGIQLAKQIRPDVVIMDINMPGIDGITAAEILTREVPGIQIIMMSVQGEADYLKRSMLAGAREFLIKPPTAEQIITSIRRVYSLSQAQRAQYATPPPVAAPSLVQPQTLPQGAHPSQTAQASGKRGEVFALFGAKGGVGASSICVNLAIALQEQQPNARIAIVDGNTEFGDLSVLLNLNVSRSIIDLIAVEELDAQYINDVMIPHASGIKVIPGSPPTEAELVTNEQVKRVIEALRRQFDYVFFDTRTTFTEPILTILDNADTIVLVTTADIPSIRNARLFFEVTDQLDYSKDKITLVLNKYDQQGTVSAQAIQASIKHPIRGELPRDDRLVNASIQQGLPYVMSHPRSPLSLALINLARVTSGMAVMKNQPEPEIRAQPVVEEAPRKPSLFGRLLGRK